MLTLNALLLSLTTLSTICAARSSALGFTNIPPSVAAGQAYRLQYAPGRENELVTITLCKDAQAITTLTSSATNGSYLWTVQGTLETGSDYALGLEQGDEISYSGEFAINSLAASHASLAAATPLYNSSLYEFMAMTMAAMSMGSPSGPVARNMPSSQASSGASATGSSGSVDESGSHTANPGSATSSAHASTSTSAAGVRAVSAISGASPLALVFCVFASMML